MNHGRSKQTRIRRIATHTQRTLLPLVAAGGGIASVPANALELGDVTVESGLGQPLRASIAYALAPHEELSDSCVTLGLGASATGLPAIGRATLSIADGTILLTGRTPVREPMVAAMINVDCAYTANLSREYLMFFDPAVPAADSQPAASVNAQARPAVNPSVERSAPRSAATSVPVNRAPIGQSTQYRVQSGDTLSQIVQRIEDRSTSLWPAVNAIFDANPDAFIDNDPNKLKAGSLLTIPSFLGAQSATNSAAGVNTRAGFENTNAAQAAVKPAATMSAPTESADAGPASPTSSSTSSGSSTSDSSSDLRPATASDNPFVDGAVTSTETVIISDTEIEGPITVSTSPNVTTATANSASEPTGSSSSWLLWLAGSGLALIVALLVFGRLFRGRPGDAEIAAVVPQRRATDQHPGVAQDETGIEVVTHTGYTIDDDSPTAENLALDADLVMGTGLEAGAEIEVAEDFGFASPTEVDVELPFEPEAGIAESDTSLFALDDDETSVMENHDVAEDDDYDFSVVLDATKMPRPDDITQQDLQAVEVQPVDDIGKTGSYTIESEVDLEILEQDYEDELTATQALNAEIVRAAEELAKDSAGQALDDYEITTEMTAATPMASVTELDATAEMPSSDVEGNETGMQDDATLEMPATDSDETGIHDAATLEMPAADNDETAALDLDEETVDFKII